MAEFYVTYDRDGQHFVALVVAKERPASLQFASREDLYAAMEALGQKWELQGEIHDLHEYASEASAAWLKQLNEVKSMKLQPKPEVYLFGRSGSTGAATGSGFDGMGL